MNNPYEKTGNFESGFSFESEGKKYRIQTGETETLEGNKYRVGLFEEGADTNTLPLQEYVALTPEELNEEVKFLKELTVGELPIEEVKKQWMAHIIDSHNAHNAEKESKL